MNGELRAFRVGLCISQTDMARILGVDRPNLSRMESGDRNIPAAVAERFLALRARTRKAVLG